MKVTISDVAKKTGFSVTTVSHALNDKGSVNSKTRNLIKSCAEEMGYIPNQTASSLRTGKRNTIAIISSMPLATSNTKSKLGFLFTIVSEITHNVIDKNYNILLSAPIKDRESLYSFSDIAGAIIVEPTNNDIAVHFCQQQSIPFVSIGKSESINNPVNFVDMNYEAVANELLQHLEQQGCRSIGLIVGTSNRLSQSVIVSIYRDYIALRTQSERIAYADEELGKEGGYNAAKELFGEKSSIDALIVSIDTFAEGVYSYLDEYGLKVPSNIKVCTRFDGLISQRLTPPVTAVDLQLEKAALIATNKLFVQMGEGSTLDQDTTLKPSVVIKQSTSLENN